MEGATPDKKQQDKTEFSRADQEEKQQKRKKRLCWALLACLLLALLFGVAVAIAVPVSRQNAANRAKALQSPASKGPKGPPLTFKVDVAVPPDDDPTAPPVCGSMFGGSPDGNKKVEVRGVGVHAIHCHES